MSTSNKGHNCFIIFFKTREKYTLCIQYFICDPMGINGLTSFHVFIHVMPWETTLFFLNNFFILAYLFQIISLVGENRGCWVTLDRHIIFAVTRRYGVISLVGELGVVGRVTIGLLPSIAKFCKKKTFIFFFNHMSVII